MSNNETKRMVGYARVSTTEQNLALQVEALAEHGIPRNLIFTDRMTGGTMKRPGLQKALLLSQHMGTEFVVWKLDRLGRTTLGILTTLELFKERGIKLRSITEPLDLDTSMGQTLLTVLASFAELERNHIRERTMAGLARARERGEIVGRKNAMTPDRVAAAEKMMADGVTAAAMLKTLKEIDPDVGLSRSRVFDWRKDYAAINPDDLTDDR